LKYIAKPATNAEGTQGWGIFTRTTGLYWYPLEGPCRIEANVLELKHLQEKMDKVLETLEILDPTVDPRDYLA
jgi:hypothetical protein